MSRMLFLLIDFAPGFREGPYVRLIIATAAATDQE